MKLRKRMNGGRIKTLLQSWINVIKIGKQHLRLKKLKLICCNLKMQRAKNELYITSTVKGEEGIK